MGSFPSCTGAASIAYQIQKTRLLNRSWHLRWKPVCSSTEIELSRWVKNKPIFNGNPRACLARRQTHGRGQRGRYWSSLAGGVWLSAAIPCDASKRSAGLFGLGVAVALVRRLETNCISAQIKWPNDVLVDRRKIAGLLPRVVYRGQDPTILCIGIGLNVSNKVPSGGISISEIPTRGGSSISKWSLEVLLAIEEAIILIKEPKSLCEHGEKLLWARQIKQSKSNQIWNIDGLDLEGQLRVRRGLIKEKWDRWQ